ncbi:MAG: CotH kinase family protein [Flavobacteriales bacterium]
MSKGVKKKRKVIRLVMGLILLGVLAGFVGDRLLKRKGHPGLRRFVAQWVGNYPKSFAIEPPLLSIHVGDLELERLQNVVNEARERGVILPEGNEYVSAELTSNGKTFKARVRIKGKMTDHVKGDKWSFRVIAKKDGGFLGMRRFSLQHPGTRNYLYEWVHQRLMRGEGIVALRYGFIRLEFNGEDRGIYAYEEHFGPELLEHNARVDGPLFRFDPGLFWQHRLNEMEGVRYDEPFAAYQAAAVDAYGTGAISKDPKATRDLEEAVALMNAFRNAELPASQVFDADRVARRLALLDVLGGHRSLDWSDAKFYYDPVLRRIEPVAYESFSAHPIRTIAGAYQWAGRTDPSQDLHTAWFNDPVLFKAYIHHLERFSRATYIDSALHALAPALDTASATVYGEFPYKELDASTYYANQRIIRQVLNDPKGFHAYRDGREGDTLSISAVPIGSLPIEIHGIRFGDADPTPVIGGTILPIRQVGKPGVPATFRFLMPAGPDENMDLSVVYSVLGASVRKEEKVLPFRLLDGVGVSPVAGTPRSDLRALPFLSFSDDHRTILLKSGEWTIDKDLVIPAGLVVKGVAPLKLVLKEGARIISSSPVLLQGTDEAPITIAAPEGGSSRVVLMGNGGRSEWGYVHLEGPEKGMSGTGAMLLIDGVGLIMDHCRVTSMADGGMITAVRAELRMDRCMVTGGRDQLASAFSTVVLDHCSFSGASDDCIVARGGALRIVRTQLLNVKGIGLKLNTSAMATLDLAEVQAAGKGIEVKEGSVLTVKESRIHAQGAGVEVAREEMRYGPSIVDLQQVEISGSVPVANGKGNKVTVNGEAFRPTGTADRQ